MSVLLRRGAALQKISVEVLTSELNGQGKPVYEEAAEVYGRVHEGDSVDRGSTSTGAAGEEVNVAATVWIGGHEKVLPDFGDRLTLESGTVGIVLTRKVVRSLRNGEINHVRLGLRKE